MDGRTNITALAANEGPWTFEVDLLEPHPVRRVKVTFAAGGYATKPQIGLPADAAAKRARAAIYDESADGGKQAEEGLVRAKKENKHVLLMFGANWCGWCHRLHKRFESDAQIAAKLKQDFVVVMIDVNQNHNADVNQRYGNPTRFGLPVLMVLDAAGRALTTQDTGKLEEGDHDQHP